MTLQVPLYSCKHCGKPFYKERAFMSHECTEMVRAREIQTIAGQTAYALYKHWLEKQRRKPPAVEGFIASSYYTSFFKFAQWCKETGIADPTRYVDLMLNQQIAPALWRRNEAYQIYLEWMDKLSDPNEQAQVTVDTLFAEAERRSVELPQVFSAMAFGEVYQLVQQRKLTPWVLFCSTAFKAWLSQVSEHERKTFLQSVNPDYWAMQFERKPEVLKFMRVLVQELGI